ncbi:uncharacterized protein NFIA_113060 [Aspergillus fischeri NRRL 181]|uniref:Uncharacterized protein n=1 Tax=Neosartorya fischeri (strain ATCC 1020 / DSM 3700 / CBS 544.65 / FGSC A1164 / JCM 1740 / NRRL 181 / WB 181) TaxID=331117 RepID=A1D8R7_NEOFI|nr:uncharacterized protein NFIA_113060 [Aspergillus fischeri NRRL 181]EAW20778.1 hypothetical protein NFIA_113060 [Aspergillus fischeri NRRL 181]
MDHLLRQADENMRHVPYRSIINSVGKEDLIEVLFNGICPEIRKLEGKKITVKELETVREEQLSDGAGPWRTNSGYLDFILDNRNEQYWRAYVNPLDKFVSDGPQEEVSIKAAKGATVKQALQAEMDLDEDTDVTPDEIVTDDPNGYLKVTEEQLEEAVNAINKVLSDDPQGDTTIKAAKEAKVKQVLQVETNLTKDPDAVLEMDEETLEKARDISYSVLFQSLSQKRSPEDAVLIPRYKTRMELLNSGRFYKGCKRPGDTVTAELPMYVIAAIKVPPDQLDAKHNLRVRAELKPPGERHPNRWATQARDSDPGARLGITVTREEGDRKITTYATNNGY